MTNKEFLVQYIGFRKEAGDANISDGNRDALQLQKRLSNAGVNSSVKDDTITFSNKALDVPNALFKTKQKGNLEAAETVERETQKARAKHLGETYKDGTIYDVPVHMFPYGSIYQWMTPNTVDRTPGYTNSYTVGGSLLTDLGAVDEDRAHAPWVGLNGALYRNSDLGTVLHEVNHFFTPGVHGGTNQPYMKVNPEFEAGGEGSYRARNFAWDSTGVGYLPLRLRKLKANYAKKYPGYPVAELPDSYYNSAPEFYTGARSLKQFLASNNIRSVGLNKDLSYKSLPNGTYPFNAAMVVSGLWRVNPKYNYKSRYVPGRPYVPKYVPEAIPDDFSKSPRTIYFPNIDKRFNPGSDLAGRINMESRELLKHINFMQYLIDLGEHRTDAQEELLQLLRERLPIMLETANVSSPKRYSNVV